MAFEPEKITFWCFKDPTLIYYFSPKTQNKRQLSEGRLIPLALNIRYNIIFKVSSSHRLCVHRIMCITIFVWITSADAIHYKCNITQRKHIYHQLINTSSLFIDNWIKNENCRLQIFLKRGFLWYNARFYWKKINNNNNNYENIFFYIIIIWYIYLEIEKK